MILHFAKENDFKVSRPAGLARSAREGGREGGEPSERAGSHLSFHLPLSSSCPPPGGRPWG